MFGASVDYSTRLRSLSAKTLINAYDATRQITGATANGNGWYIGTWAQRELIRTLLVLIGKSTDSQAVFGNGFSGATLYGELPKTGILKNKGQFFGYNTNNQQVKVFHIEEFWGTQKKRIAGLINYNGKIYVKMTPEDLGYQLNDVTGYTDTNIVLPSVTKRFITQARCGDFGMIPIFKRGGSSATYFCDTMYSNNTQLYYLLAGVGSDDITTSHGAFTFDVNTPPSMGLWVIGCTLSYV